MGIFLLPPVAIGRAAPEPAGGFGSDRQESGTLGLGASIRGAHLLVPGTGPRVVPRLRARVAQSRTAQGQQGQQGRRPAAGCSGSGRGLLTHLEPHKAVGCGAGGTGSRLGRSAAPPAPRPHASALASPRSLNDAQVPPGAALFISLPSPKRDSSLHQLSALRLSAGGSGERAKGLGTRVSVTEFPIIHSFGLFPNPSSSASHLPNSAPPAPPEVQRASDGPHLDPRGLSPARSPGLLHQLFPRGTYAWGRGGSASISSSEAPPPSTQQSLRSWAKVEDAGALPGAASTRLELSKCAGCSWTVDNLPPRSCKLSFATPVFERRCPARMFLFLSIIKADGSVRKMLCKHEDVSSDPQAPK